MDPELHRTEKEEHEFYMSPYVMTAGAGWPVALSSCHCDATIIRTVHVNCEPQALSPFSCSLSRDFIIATGEEIKTSAQCP